MYIVDYHRMDTNPTCKGVTDTLLLSECFPCSMYRSAHDWHAFKKLAAGVKHTSHEKTTYNWCMFPLIGKHLVNCTSLSAVGLCTSKTSLRATVSAKGISAAYVY